VNALDKEVLGQVLHTLGLSDKLNQLWSVHCEGFLTQDDLIARASHMFPDFALLFDLWENTPLKHMALTSVGIAIGYANLKRVCGFDADLSIWIK
jgi:hypothetical protein